MHGEQYIDNRAFPARQSVGGYLCRVFSIVTIAVVCSSQGKSQIDCLEKTRFLLSSETPGMSNIDSGFKNRLGNVAVGSRR